MRFMLPGCLVSGAIPWKENGKMKKDLETVTPFLLLLKWKLKAFLEAGTDKTKAELVEACREFVDTN